MVSAKCLMCDGNIVGKSYCYRNIVQYYDNNMACDKLANIQACINQTVVVIVTLH